MSDRTAARLARSLGILCAALLALGLFFLALNGFATLMTLNRPEFGSGLWVFDAIIVATFPQAGLSNTYLLIINLGFAALFTPAGVLVASRRPSNSIGWLFCVVGLLSGVLVFADQYTVYALLTRPGSLPGGVAMAWLASWVWILAIIFIVVLLPLLFPDGQPPTRRWWPIAWLAVFGLVISVASIAFLPGPINADLPAVENPFGIWRASATLKLSFGVGVIFEWACILAAVASLILRLPRSEGQERQQLKWFVYAVTMCALTLIAGTLVRGVASFDVAGTILQLAALPFLPAVVGIAILKHRLYDIDFVINRTLVYGALTATLALLYVGGVLGLQYLFRELTGEESQLAVVASTLAIAALFGPLRGRVQDFIDRRFYRREYDAAKTLEAFSAKLREETNLDALNNELLAVVQETIQPEHVSLWLRPSEKDE